MILFYLFFNKHSNKDTFGNININGYVYIIDPETSMYLTVNETNNEKENNKLSFNCSQGSQFYINSSYNILYKNKYLTKDRNNKGNTFILSDKYDGEYALKISPAIALPSDDTINLTSYYIVCRCGEFCGQHSFISNDNGHLNMSCNLGATQFNIVS
jgi:hypothetical protein